MSEFTVPKDPITLDKKEQWFQCLRHIPSHPIKTLDFGYYIVYESVVEESDAFKAGWNSGLHFDPQDDLAATIKNCKTRETLSGYHRGLVARARGILALEHRLRDECECGLRCKCRVSGFQEQAKEELSLTVSLIEVVQTILEG